MNCPKCHSNHVEVITLGNIEREGTYAAAVTGIAALKIGASLMGLRTMTPSWKSVKNGTDELGVPKQYKCLRCGHIFHGRDFK